MPQISRKKARIEVFNLLFESPFRAEDTPEVIFTTSVETREVPEDDYIREAYLGTMEHREEIDALINRFAKGWKTNRISGVSLAAMRLCVYELLYREDIPANISINEAVEIVKTYDDPKMKGFVNGTLDTIAKSLKEKGPTEEQTPESAQ